MNITEAQLSGASHVGIVDDEESIYERNLEQFEFIDIRDEDEVLSSWSDFVHTHHYDFCNDFFKSSLAKYPRRTAEAYWCHNFFSNVEEAFAEENQVPDNFETFEEMWNWYQPMIEKENYIK